MHMFERERMRTLLEDGATEIERAGESADGALMITFIDGAFRCRFAGQVSMFAVGVAMIETGKDMLAKAMKDDEQ